MDLNQLASDLFGSKRAESRTTPSTISVMYGIATSDSADGAVSVWLSDNALSPSDALSEWESVDSYAADAYDGMGESTSMEIPTEVTCFEGDVVRVQLTGAGAAKNPTVVGVVGRGDEQNERLATIEADYIKTTELEADVARIGFLKADSAVIGDIKADTAKVHDLTADQLSAATGFIADLTAGEVTADSIIADKAKLAQVDTEQLTADHAVIEQLDATYASISSLNAATARIGDIEADYLKAADMEAEQARVGQLVAGKADIADLTAANGRIDNLQSTKADISVLESDYITAETIEATYMHANMSNSDVAWIQNGVIKDGSISNAMINDVSANKLTAGTINGEVINVTNLNADNITAGTINGQRIGEGSLSLDKLSEDVYTEQEVDNKLATMQAEIDGAIETWTGTAVPTLNNSPASNWTTAAVRDTHVGDVYFVVNSQSEQNGYNYRFTKSGSTYSWQLIKDSDVTNALQRINTAEGKITTFDSDISTLKTDTGTLKTKTTNLETRMSDAEDDILDKVDTTTFNELSSTVDENSASISTFSTVISNNGLTETTNITSTVNTVSQTATGNSSKLSQLTTTLGTNADGTTKEGDIVHRTSAVEQDLSGFKTTVSNTYATKTALSGVETTANNANGKSVAYSATSSTGASTAAKVASCTNFPTLVAGTTVTVRFSAANTSTGAITLNVNSTGAKTIYVNGAATSSTNQLLWSTNANITFTYDGTYWRVVSEPRTWYGSCSTAAATAAKTSTINEVVICKGTSVTLNMTYDNTNTSATLNITSTGAKNIYYGTTSTRPTTENGYGWTSASTVTLVFDGAYWRIGDTSALKGLATVNSTVSQHTTLIEQNSEAIAAKANASDVYTTTQVDGLITTEVNNRNAAIEASADSITTSVSNNYATKTALQETNGNVSSLTTRVSTAETNITQNANNITLKAKKMETIDGNMLYDVDAPNLTKIFGPANRYFSDSGNASFMVCDIRAVTDSPAAGIEYMAHWSVSGSSDNKQRGLCFYTGNYVQFVTGQKYILSCWVRCTSGKFTYCNNAYATSFPTSSGARTIDSSVDSGWQFVTTTVTATKTQLDRIYFMARTLSDSLAFECDMCGFKMTVAAYATQAELKVTNDSISSKVSTTDYNGQTIASLINQSADSVVIEAEHIELNGTTVFNTIKSSLDSNYDAKGAAQTVQDNLDNLEIGGRNLWIASRITSSTGNPTTSNGLTFEWNRDTYEYHVYGTNSKTDAAWETFNGYLAPAINYLKCESGDVLTLSVDGDDIASQGLYVAINAYVNGSTSQYGAVYTTDTKSYITVTLPDKHDSSKPFSTAFIGVFPTAREVDVTFKVKLERGNKVTDWSPAPEDVTADALVSGIEYIEGTQTAATNLWTGVTKETALVAGKSIAYKLTYAGTSTAATLNLTLAGGGTTGAKAVKMVYSTSSDTGALSNVTTHWPVNSIIQMTYDGTQWVISNYNTNVDDKNARNVRFYNTIVAGEALNAASIIGMHADGKFYQVKGNATFLLSAPLLWLTTAKAAAATNADAIYTHAYDVSLATYYTSFVNTKKNCTVYLVGTVNGNIFSTYGSSSAQYLTVTEPTTEDGRFYIPLGRLSNTSTGKNYFNYVVDYPVSLYAYLDGRFRQVTPTEIVASHRVYYRTDTATSSLAAPTSWVTEATGNVYNAWTTKVPPLAVSTESGQQKYLFLYTCEQRKRLDGTIQCTGVQLDENTTVIDGGNIITGSVTANQLSANAVTADKIAANALTLGKFTAADKLLVDNSQVQVGGRNYVLSSSGTLVSGLGSADDSHKEYQALNVGQSYMDIPHGTQVTISFDLYMTVNTANPELLVYNTNNKGPKAFSALANGTGSTAGIRKTFTASAGSVIDERVSVTGYINDRTSPSLSDNFLEFYSNYGSSNWFSISNLKLEKGNKATDWSPAPEDVDESILSVSRDLNDQIEPINEGITTLTNDVTEHENRLTTNEQAIANVQNMVNNLASTTSWLSFTAEQGLIIGDSSSGDSYFYTQQKGSFMSFNQMSASGSTELMRLSGENGIEGPKVTVNEVNTDMVTIGDDWSITVSGDMFSINYIGS